MNLDRINFHHLHYFWAVAHDGNLTRTASQLRVSQSALSAQIRQLEDQLGHDLFTREGRKLLLTEAGRITLAHADAIFAAGHSLVDTLKFGRSGPQTLRIGAVATLSRNFQESFVRPVLAAGNVRLSIEAAGLEDLVERLLVFDLDLVLANRTIAPRTQALARIEPALRCQRVARQPVSLIGPKRSKPFRFPEDLDGLPVVLPGRVSDTRREFDVLCEELGVRVDVRAEVDDVATMRLLARATSAVTLVPAVVVREELTWGSLHAWCVVPGLFESFYAITVERQFSHPLVDALLARSEADLLAL